MTVHAVALVGAGPGHPGLLTLRAAECLRRADVVLYDRLVPVALLGHAPATARLICVEDLPGDHPARWPHIHQALIDHARQGRRVVRLKGGDPFVFGRGAEEAEALRAAGIAYEIVPGVTAGLGATAFAGVPVTHRERSSAVAFVTAHEYPGKPGSRLDWPALARFPGTLVFYMGVSRLEAVVAALTDNGKDAATPAAVIERGTTARQRTVTAPLAGLADTARAAGVRAPALVVVGEVVELHASLNWFERLPLAGRRVLITRPRHQAAEMGAAVVEQGGEPVYLPVVDVAPPEAWDEVDRHLAALGSYQWVVFTSANGVRSFLDRLRATGRDLRTLGGARLAAIGPATADALRAYHLEPDLVPATYNSEGLVEALRGPVSGGRVLLARADRGLDLLRQELGQVAHVEQVAVYRQVDLSPDGEGLTALSRGEIDLVSLTSTNIALGLARAMDEAARAHITSGRTKLVTISPRTSAAVREAGLPVAAEATEHTTAGVLAAMRELVSERP